MRGLRGEQPASAAAASSSLFGRLLSVFDRSSSRDDPTSSQFQGPAAGAGTHAQPRERMESPSSSSSKSEGRPVPRSGSGSPARPIVRVPTPPPGVPPARPSTSLRQAAPTGTRGIGGIDVPNAPAAAGERSEILRTIDELWLAVSGGAAAGLEQGRYVQFHQCMFRALRSTFDEADALRRARSDFLADAQGGASVSRARFLRMMQSLAERWCSAEGPRPDLELRFLRRLLAAITCPDLSSPRSALARRLADPSAVRLGVCIPSSRERAASAPAPSSPPAPPPRPLARLRHGPLPPLQTAPSSGTGPGSPGRPEEEEEEEGEEEGEEGAAVRPRARRLSAPEREPPYEGERGALPAIERRRSSSQDASRSLLRFALLNRARLGLEAAPRASVNL
eukprot:tig00021318_g20149.t1